MEDNNEKQPHPETVDGADDDAFKSAIMGAFGARDLPDLAISQVLYLLRDIATLGEMAETVSDKSAAQESALNHVAAFVASALADIGPEVLRRTTSL